jgi:lipopolysaccharide transport system ATP-binding protein
MRPAIRVENLSKQYRIGAAARSAAPQLREIISSGAKGLWNQLRRHRQPTELQDDKGSGTFWALKDVSFEVHPGEVIGIIGRNGAGKSTLLKILSRIIEPTLGRADVYGRLSSLLEVGTGFHPELTGRENIYLNGSILGMSHREISRQFDEIVDFADVGRFLDTPVKRYSSGMHVRLGFAVAAHLDPEILLVDEVLAVGDVQFQRKCLGKMQNAATNGRTVFLVSHQMDAIRRLCPRTILMGNGRLIAFGETEQTMQRYFEDEKRSLILGEWVDLKHANHVGNEEAWFVAACVGLPDERPLQLIPDQPLKIRLRIFSNSVRLISSLAVTFYDRYGTKLVNADSDLLGEVLSLKPGLTEVEVGIRQLHLTAGTYKVGLWLASHPIVYDHVPDAFSIEIEDVAYDKLGRRPGDDGRVTCEFSVVNLSHSHS